MRKPAEKSISGVPPARVEYEDAVRLAAAALYRAILDAREEFENPLVLKYFGEQYTKDAREWLKSAEGYEWMHQIGIHRGKVLKAIRKSKQSVI